MYTWKLGENCNLMNFIGLYYADWSLKILVFMFCIVNIQTYSIQIIINKECRLNIAKKMEFVAVSEFKLW